MYLAIFAGSLRAGGGLVALDGMWSPGIAAILTQLFYRKSQREFGWKWGKTKYQLWSYAIPALYAFTTHGFVWFRLKSGSLWTGMFLHASHNLFIQGLPGLTTDKGITVYLIDEFGAVSAAVALIVAFIFWKKRGQLSL